MTMKPVDPAAKRPAPASRIDRANPPEPSRSAAPAMGAAVRSAPDAQPTPEDPAESRPMARGASTAGVEKERRCGELEKRIISLERRLSSPLTSDAMDDTVVQMARYQQNVDRHCR